MVKQLSAVGISHLRTPGKYYDGSHGLFLEVYSTGAKTFQQRVTVNGKRRAKTLGRYPVVSLAEARATACQNWLVARSDRDPFPACSKVEIPTFAQAAAEVIKQKAPTWTDPKYPKDWQYSLERYVFPSLGERPISQIEVQDVVEVLAPIWNKIPETARRMRQRIRAILDWGVAMGHCSDNAAGPALHGVLPKRRPPDKSKRHHPAVPYAEVPAVVVALRGMRARPRLRLLLEFVVLTAGRCGEARGARWGEFDFDSVTWTVPGSRMKTGFPHRVPLSGRALEILRELGPDGAPDGLVFPGKKSGTAFSGDAVLGLVRRLGLRATVHGFRSSFRNWVAETDAATHDVAERALAHARTNQTVAAYLNTDLLELRRPLMQRWADHVTSVGSV